MRHWRSRGLEVEGGGRTGGGSHYAALLILHAGGSETHIAEVFADGAAGEERVFVYRLLSLDYSHIESISGMRGKLM
jgi:hypothetical protein